jgi:glycosyltransferase involved in cell wall biosynthesis
MPGRVLVVAYNFPPVGGVGIMRTLKYVTYLPDSGWEPVVVTAKNPGVAIRDEDSERTLPAGLRVERAFSPEPAKVRHALGRVVKRMRQAGGDSAGEVGTASGGAAPSELRSTSPWPGRLATVWATATHLTFFPDEQVAWAPFAARAGLAVHRDTPVDVVYSSSAPISCHLAVGLIASKADLPWVADFRDPWIGNAFAARPRGLHAFLQLRIERRIVALADRVVFPTRGVAEGYAARYPEAADRFVVIPNGYDRSDFPSLGARPPAAHTDGRFHVAYGGSLYGDRELEILLDGIELLVSRRPGVRDLLAVDFIGWLNLRNQAVARSYATPERLGPMLSFAGFLPHREAMARLSAADALLQLIGDGPNRGQIQGGKLMEYVGLDRPILAVVPEGDARALLRELDWGICADPTPAGVAEGFERLLAAPLPTRRADPEGRYDRVNLAMRLAAVLDEVADERTGPVGV